MKSLYQITRNTNEMDISVIHSVIATSYWANAIPKETLLEAISKLIFSAPAAFSHLSNAHLLCVNRCAGPVRFSSCSGLAGTKNL